MVLLKPGIITEPHDVSDVIVQITHSNRNHMEIPGGNGVPVSRFQLKTSRATYKTDHTLIRTDCKVFCKHRDESVAYEWISNIICEQLLDDLSLFSLSLQCVVAVQSALCPKAAMRLVAVCVNQSFRALDANSAGLDSTPTPTVKVRKQKHKPEKRVCINAHILY